MTARTRRPVLLAQRLGYPGAMNEAPRPPRRLALAIAGFVLVVAAPFIYGALIANPVTARTGWPMFAAMLAGIALAVLAARRDARRRTRAVAVFSALVALGWTWLFFGGMRVPAATPLVRAPDFTLADPSGRSVTLSQVTARGPVLLVFYRGFW